MLWQSLAVIPDCSLVKTESEYKKARHLKRHWDLKSNIRLILTLVILESQLEPSVHFKNSRTARFYGLLVQQDASLELLQHLVVDVARSSA